MKNLITCLIIVSFFEVHTQTPEPAVRNSDHIKSVGAALFGAGLLIVADADDFMHYFTLYMGEIPIFYPIGVALMLTGSVMILVSHRKKSKPDVWTDMCLPAYTCHGDEVRQPSLKKLFQQSPR